MTLMVFLLTLGATARLTRLVTDDYIARHLRAYVIRHTSEGNDLRVGIGCPWCLGVWISAGLFTLAYFHGSADWFVWPAAALSASWLYGIAATILDGDPAPAEEPAPASGDGTAQ